MSSMCPLEGSSSTNLSFQHWDFCQPSTALCQDDSPSVSTAWVGEDGGGWAGGFSAQETSGLWRHRERGKSQDAPSQTRREVKCRCQHVCLRLCWGGRGAVWHWGSLKHPAQARLERAVNKLRPVKTVPQGKGMAATKLSDNDKTYVSGRKQSGVGKTDEWKPEVTKRPGTGRWEAPLGAFCRLQCNDMLYSQSLTVTPR